MKIIKATKEYAKKISELMFKDLENPDSRFPVNMISKFREHAKEVNIVKEFDNPNFICFLAVENYEVISFIVGYKENLDNAIIHYIAGNCIKVKELLLEKFIDECKKEKIVCVMADSFEFMENDKLFKKKEFILTKKEKIADNLELLWYKLIIAGKND